MCQRAQSVKLKLKMNLCAYLRGYTSSDFIFYFCGFMQTRQFSLAGSVWFYANEKTSMATMLWFYASAEILTDSHDVVLCK